MTLQGGSIAKQLKNWTCNLEALPQAQAIITLAGLVL